METTLLGGFASSKLRENYLGILGYSVFGFIESLENNSIVFNSTISNRDRPKLIASRLGRYVASFPTLISSGKIKAGGSTHIIDTLVELSPTLDCEAQDTTIQVLTDGLETSGDGTKFNEKKGTITLPTYGAGEFKGCHLEMYGIGKLSKNSNARLTRALRTAWTKWAKSAGFKSVRLFSNW